MTARVLGEEGAVPTGDRGRRNGFQAGDLLDFHHGGVVRRCRVVSPAWSDNTGVVVEIELPDGRVVRCHDTDLRFPPPAGAGSTTGAGSPVGEA